MNLLILVQCWFTLKTARSPFRLRKGDGTLKPRAVMNMIIPAGMTMSTPTKNSNLELIWNKRI